MRTFILGVLLLPVFALAEPVTVEKPVVCDRVEKVFEELQGQSYKEQPIWIGAGENSTFTIFANEKTKTWTVVQFNDNIACVLGMGDNGRLIFLKNNL